MMLDVDLGEAVQADTPRAARDEIAELRRELAESRQRESLLAATLESAGDGIIAYRFGGGGYFYNNAFVRMWNLPPERMPSLDGDELLALQGELLREPEALISQVHDFDPDAEHFTVVELKDGRVLERHARPQRENGRSVGRVIAYRDVTQRIQQEGELREAKGAGSDFWFTARVGLAEMVVLPSAPAPAPAAAPRGARLLLVEDNDINQHVACEMLSQAGFQVDVAENGRIGADMALAGNYALVLMDMQMPVMDGLAATRAIRADARGARLPIVAMTANAMERDRERCMQAGMNDFVSKPVDPDRLMRVIARCIGEARPAAAAPASADGLPVIAGLDTALGLKRTIGKKPLYLALLKRFADGQRGTVAAIRAALEAGDRATAERLAHTAKGSGATIGAMAVAAAAEALEHALHDGAAAGDLAPLIAALERQLAPVVEGLATAA